jgi:hypothetical protein
MKQILISKSKNSMVFLKLAFCSAMLLTSCLGTSFASNGNIIYQNCATGSCTGAGSSNGWARTIESSGCHSGECLKLVGKVNTNSGSPGYGAGNTAIATTSVAGYREITISYWIKLSEKATSIRDGNFKGTRLYTGGETYWASDIVPHFGGDFYTSAVVGTIRPASWFKMVTYANNKGYPVNNGDGTYTSSQGWIKGTIQSGGPTPVGTSWVHITKWIRLPSTSTSTDGAIKFWVGNSLALDIYNTKFKYTANASKLSKITFYPSSEATEPFEHWMDDMVIYEGYVPPSGDVTSPPPSNNILPSTPAGFKEE